MSFEIINERGIVLLGCGKMGSAMLRGWLGDALNIQSVNIIDPNPSDWVLSLSAEGASLNSEFPQNPAVCILAVKPQIMGEALPALQSLGNGDTLFISIAAGTPISMFEDMLGSETPIIRAMPNTPAAISKGITALIGNTKASAANIEMADILLKAVGQTVQLENEGQMDAVTAVSGSGPAYVFHLIETMAAAGVAQGLSAELSMALSKATVGGAGLLAEEAEESPSILRENVTSPGGTTAAALNVLMEQETGFPMLLDKAIKAAAERSRELG